MSSHFTVCLGIATLGWNSLFAAASQRSPASLRELTTDRPDSTESPFTVDRGHLQLEMHAASYSSDRSGGVRTIQWEAAPMNLRLGLAEGIEGGLFVSPYIEVTEKTGASESTRRGFGDVVLRAKVNIWGNNGGATAFGWIADLKLPTASGGLGNNQVEGGVTFPIAYELGGGWDGAVMTSVQANCTDRGRRPVWLNTITFAHAITRDLGGFFEATSSAGDGSHQATFNCGLTYRTDSNTQVDCGLNVGISKAAPDLMVFVGLSRRY